jgi:hypothetical protein
MKEFFEHLNRLTKPNRPDIIEKDYHLHRLLKRMSLHNYFKENLVFKGGTCLVKAYTGYFRFSEDLDFTWKDQTKWEGKNPSQVKKECSTEINTILEHLVGIVKELGLDFKGEKSNVEQVIISGGGRMPRFYLKYNSEILDVPVKIKVEINFVDKYLYPSQTKELGTYITDIQSEETSFLYKDQWTEYSQPVTIECYDPREIYTEKARAALTRIKYKLRDIIDIHMLQQQYGYTIPEYKDQINEKTRYILDIYQKYREVIETKTLPEAEDIIPEELQLLTIEPPSDLEQNIQKINEQIREIQTELM